MLRIKPTKFETLFIACSGFPMCKIAMGMPKGILDFKKIENSTC